MSKKELLIVETKKVIEQYTTSKGCEKVKGWRVDEWTGISEGEPMTEEEIEESIEYLRKNNYPKPEDCPKEQCPGYRPACKMGICYVAVRLCGDF